MPPTILVTDDQGGIRRYCKEELEAEGMHVLLAQDGDEALAILADSDVDLVVLDAHMPGCSGIETARYVKQKDSTMPVVLFTLDTDYARYRSDWIDRCVIKSADLEELKQAIRFELAAKARNAMV